MPTEAHWINIQRPRGLEDSAIPAEIAKVFVTGSMWLLLHQPQKPFRSVGFLIAEVFSVHAAWSTLLSRGGFTHVHKRERCIDASLVRGSMESGKNRDCARVAGRGCHWSRPSRTWRGDSRACGLHSLCPPNSWGVPGYQGYGRGRLRSA